MEYRLVINTFWNQWNPLWQNAVELPYWGLHTFTERRWILTMYNI